MLIVLSGGAASGKSEHAERLLCARTSAESRLYLACMQPFGEDAAFRIARHRKLRAGKGFVTQERYTDLKNWQPEGEWQGILLECMSNLLANEIYSPEGAHENAYEEILHGIDHLCKLSQTLVIVTNEVFADGLPYDSDTCAYIAQLGRINCALAERADFVGESVCGILVPKKGRALYRNYIQEGII